MATGQVQYRKMYVVQNQSKLTRAKQIFFYLKQYASFKYEKTNSGKKKSINRILRSVTHFLRQLNISQMRAFRNKPRCAYPIAPTMLNLKT